MKYFHRTAVSRDRVLSDAEAYFGRAMKMVRTEPAARTFTGPIGSVTVHARAEGGHYTLITVSTDAVGESEVDKLAKRFLAFVHRTVHDAHVVRGAY